MRSPRLLKATAFALAALFFIQKAAGQTTWIGPTGGSWFSAANWSAGLPAAGNKGTIPGGASVAVGAALTVDFDFDNFGAIAVTAPLTNETGTIANSGTMTFSGAGSMVNKKTFQNFAAATFQPSATFTNETGAMLANGGTFTVETTLTNRGAVENNGTVSAPSGAILTAGSTFDNRQILNTKSLTISANGTFINNFGSNLTIAGAGAELLVAVTGQFTNLGTVNVNAGNLTINGAFSNSVTLNVAAGAAATVAAGATLTQSGTFLNKGTFSNNGTTTNSNQFLNEGTATNSAQFNNNDKIENRLGGTFTNAAAGVILGNFGSSIINFGAFSNLNSITTPGILQNDGTFTNSATMAFQSGSLFENNATFNNNGILATENSAQNDGTLNNSGTLTVRSGSIFLNNAAFRNNPSGRVVVLFEFKNSTPAAVLTNNGTFENTVRTFIDAGTATNNGYFLNTGDVFVAAGATLGNAGLFNQNAGNVQQKGSLTNSGTFLNDDCSTISNTSSISNSGSIQNRGLIFQRGTVSGTAISNDAGSFTHTTAGAASTAICKQTFSPSADIDGTIKVYGTALVVPANVDSCQNILYTANGIPRPTFPCSVVGTTVNVNFKLKTRLGDSLTCVSPVQMRDRLAPEFSNCPSDVQIFTPDATATATWTAPTVVDNCTAQPTLTANFQPGASFPVGITGVTYTATDASTNAQQCQFRVIVTRTNGTLNCPAGDVTGPVFSNCPANVARTTEFNSEKVTWQPPTVADACGPITLSSSKRPGDDFPIGATTVVYTARDGKGNTSSCSFSITLTKTDVCATDVSKPFFAGCPSNLFLLTNANLNGAVAFWAAPAASDNCAIASLTASHQPGQIFPVGTTTVVYTATDGKANTATCAFSITVGAADPCAGDVAGPTFSGCPANQNLTTNGSQAVATWTPPTATDPCGGVVISASHSAGTAFPIGATRVTYTASDRKGNRSTCSFLVTVTNACFSDLTPPTLTACPATVQINTTSTTGATASWTAPTATDGCGAVNLSASYTPGAFFPLGTTTVVYTATDAKSNASTCSFNVIVTNAAPCKGTQGTGWTRQTWTGVAGTAISNLTSLATYPNSPNATDVVAGAGSVWNAADNYGVRVRGFITPTVTGSYQFTLTGDDETRLLFAADGLAASAVQVASVPTFTGETEFTKLPEQRSAALTLTAGKDYYIEILQKEGAGGDGWALYWTGPSIAAPTKIALPLMSPYLLNCTPPCLVAPTVVCKNASKALPAGGGSVSITSADVVTSSTAGCGTVAFSFSQTAFSAAGTFPITVTATNSSGITATCSATVTVAAAPCTTVPTVVCQNVSKALPQGGGSVSITPAEVVSSSTAGCGTVAFSLSQSTFSAAGTFPVTVTATNSSGITATCSATVTVASGDACSGVTITPGASQIVVAGLGAAPIQIVQIFNAQWSQVFNCAGNCTGPTLTVPNLAAGTYFVRVDMLNSSWLAQCKKEQFVTVTAGGPTAVLTLNSVSNITVTAATGATSALVNYSAPTASTTCAGGLTTVTRTGGLASGSAFPVGVSTVNFQATDNCSNLKTTSFTVTVNPPTASTVLTINPVSNITVTAAAGATSATVNYSNPTASTTCTAGGGATTVTRTGGLASGSAFPLGATTVTFQATDGCSNAKTTAFTVTVNAAPNPGDPCAGVTITPGAGNISIGGLNGSAIQIVQVFNASWAQVFSCSGNCATPTETVPNLAAGVYFVKVDMLNAAWTPICKKEQFVTVTTGGGPTAILTLAQPSNVTVTAATGATSAAVNYTVPAASTTCAGGATTVTRTAGLPSGSLFPIGTTAITHTATDACGNEKAVTFTVTVNPAAGGGSNCAGLTFTAGAGSITVGNLTAPVTAVQVFRLPAYTSVFNCAGNCTANNLTVSGLTPGSYLVKVDFYTAGWSVICSREQTISVASAYQLNQSIDHVLNAQKAAFEVKLNWVSKTGATTNDFFVLEKSRDGLEFEPFKSLDGKGASGDILYFSETDENPTRGENFYRLRTHRRDGGIEFSAIEKVVFEALPYSIFPNPAAEKAFIDLPEAAEKSARVELFDAFGRSVRLFEFKKLGQNGCEIDLDGLGDGLFVVRVSVNGERARTLKLVKAAN